MPTAGGLPQAGEVWERTIKLPPDFASHVTRFAVLERTGGQNWGLRVFTQERGRQLWSSAAYGFSRGEFRYIGPIGPETRKKLGI